ncbi:MAG: GDSL-type esterase/lipase family protein [Treponema sp.]|nr:GDSL-type esterase/lipase family protein [Treponema sp.]
MRRFATFALIIFHCIGCAGRTTNSGELPVPGVPLNDPAVVPVNRTAKWWNDRHKSKIGDNVVKNQKIVLIGDSITEGFEFTKSWEDLNNKYKNKITNLGFSGDSTEHVIWRLENGEFPAGIDPEYVTLMIGVNNKNSPESIAAGIGKILKIISTNAPRSKILLFSILPCGKGTDDPETKRMNAVNKIIQKYDGYLNIRYIDISSLYLHQSGELIEELFARDKLHIKAEGYEIWRDVIIAAVDRKDWK